MTSIIADYPSDTLTFSWAFDIYHAGNHPEEGTPLEGHAYYISAQAPDGSRFRRHIGDVGYGFEDEFCFIDGNNDEMKATCEKVTNHLNAKDAPKINPDVWAATDPAYGSQAYQSLDNVGYWREREGK